MRLNHPDYIKLVIEAYKKKRAGNDLSRLLTQSTCAKIKKECLAVYRGRYDKKDEQVLKTFFGQLEQDRPLLQVIKGFDADKFKPLNNFLKGITERTDEKNIELLAWLINFEHRPYIYDKNFQLTEEEVELIKINAVPPPIRQPVKEPEEGKELQGPIKNDPNGKPDNAATTIVKTGIPGEISKRAIVFFLILIICTGGIYAVWQQTQGKQIITGNTGCMYWANDHYEKVACNEPSKGRLIIALDEERMQHFKRITMVDTITEQSIGQIFYLKNNGTIEYYTAGGNHPVYVTRPLKVLSAYMFENHLDKKETPHNDSLPVQNVKSLSNR